MDQFSEELKGFNGGSLITITLNANTADIVAGGSGEAGAIVLKDEQGTEIARIGKFSSPKSSPAIALLLKDAGGQARMTLNASTGDATFGGNGVEGDMRVKNAVDGAIVRFYPEAEAILEHLPRRGVPMILRAIRTRKGVAFKPYSYSGFEKLVQNLRKQISDLPGYFTLDACRHGGMTELEEAALTEGQGRALSGHKTAQSYRGYAKDTFDRALAATRKRHAHRLANEPATNVRNEGRISVRNEISDSKTTKAK